MVSSAPLLGLTSQIPHDLTESICSVMPHPSQFPHSAHSSEPCSEIRIGDTMYIIKRILFASWGLVGHGTICYLASLDEEDYIVKDHWVLSKQDDIILNEIEMLKLMQGVPGIPKLVDYWLATTSEGEVDNTQSYRKRECQSTRDTSRTHVRLVLKLCARPLHMFRTLKELVSALRDIVISKCLVELCKSIELMFLLLVQKVAVEERKILHCDCSLNNAMILDDLDISKGFLIDWEFAVRITADNKYPIGGTVSTFLSYRVQTLIHFPGHCPLHVMQASQPGFTHAATGEGGSREQTADKSTQIRLKFKIEENSSPKNTKNLLRFFGAACFPCGPRLL